MGLASPQGERAERLPAALATGKVRRREHKMQYTALFGEAGSQPFLGWRIRPRTNIRAFKRNKGPPQEP